MYGRGDADSVGRSIDREVDIDTGEAQWMAERNQIRRALCGLNAREARDAEHVAFADAARGDFLRGGGGHRDRATRDRDTRGLRLRADLHHVGRAFVVEVSESLAHSTVTDLARLRGWSTSV